jgi:hypothetical protein
MFTKIRIAAVTAIPVLVNLLLHADHATKVAGEIMGG